MDDNSAGAMKKVWLDMDQAALDAAYDQTVWAPNQKFVHARRESASEEAWARLKPMRHAYGDKPIEGLDFYSCGKAGAGVVVYTHGGSWRSGVARNFAHLADTFNNAGLHCAILDFDSIDDVKGDLLHMAQQVRNAVAWTARNGAALGIDTQRIFIAGHSSGGHLGGCILVTDWQKDFGLPADLLKGAVLMSDMYDLTPVALSKRSAFVNFTQQTIEQLSAIRRLDFVRCPVVLGYGTQESPEFQRQTKDFAAALAAAGKPHELIVCDGTNHFEMLETLHNPYGPIGRAALRMMASG